MMNILVIVIVLALAYLGVLKKFFSSLLHMACVVVAGAIAFAFWEPLSILILDKAPSRGFFEFIEYSSWAIGLVIPFAASLAILRVATDKLAPANAVAANVPDAIGAGLCGAITGIITAGILVTAVGTMQFKSDEFGYKPVRYTGASLQRTSSLMLPVDQLVGKFYAQTSETTFSTGNPLARWRPEPWHAAEVMRITEKGGRNTAKPGDFKLSARYRVEADDGENLLQDRWANMPHAATKLSGDPYPKDARIEGIILKLESSLRERGTSFIALTEAQVWMVAENATTNERLTLHPVAVVSNPRGAETLIARFPYDSPNFAISSAGAAALPWAFEFVVPNEYEPIAIYLRNVRKLLEPGQAITEFASVADRDDAISDGSLIAGAEQIPDGFGTKPDGRDIANNNDDEYDIKGIDDTNRLPNRRTIQRGSHKTLKLNDDNYIIEGESKWTPSELSSRVIERLLRVDKFGVGDNIVMVQVDVAGDSAGSLYGQAMAAVNRVLPPQLNDINGITYEAVGWVYEDRDMIYIRYTPGEPIRALSQLADKGIVLSSSRNDQKLTLLFLCTFNSQIKSFNIGPTVVFSLDEPLVLDKKQR